MFYMIIIALLASVDCFFAFFSYSASGIKAKFFSILIASIFSAVMICVGGLIGHLFASLISENIVKICSFALIFIIGCIKLCEKHDHSKDDLNKDKILSVGESFLLSSILSFDCIGLGLSLGMESLSNLITSVFCFVFCLIFSILGRFLGEKIKKIVKRSFSWLCGVTLIILALIKLIF